MMEESSRSVVASGSMDTDTTVDLTAILDFPQQPCVLVAQRWMGVACLFGSGAGDGSRPTRTHQSEDTAKLLKKLGFPDTESAVRNSDCLGAAVKGTVRRLAKVDDFKKEIQSDASQVDQAPKFRAEMFFFCS